MRARCSWVTMPLDSSRTRLRGRMSVLLKKPSARARSKRGCTLATNSMAWLTRSHRGSTATSAMKHTSRISSSRCARGSRPMTWSCPSKEVRPSSAFNAVVLPAPLGPMRPTIRPGATVKLTPSSARLAPKDLVKPRASIIVVIAVTLRGCRAPGTTLCRIRCVRSRRARAQQLLSGQAEALDGGEDLGPLGFQEALALVFHQRLAGPVADVHSQAAPLLDQLLIDQLLVPLEDRQGVQTEFRRDAADRG